jgi:hypothetical protein
MLSLNGNFLPISFGVLKATLSSTFSKVELTSFVILFAIASTLLL